MLRKSVSLIVAVAFLFSLLTPVSRGYADTVLDLPIPGTMINLSPAYAPVMIKGLTVHKDNPFLFDFIVDVGQDNASGAPLKKEGEKLIKYFLASLAIPDRDLWVNLSPYEKNRIIPEALGQTDMGRDLLEQDYILKQITASLIDPEKQLGKEFWSKVYTKAQEMYGTAQIPVNTFNKVWIMADKAEVFEHNQTAFVVNQHLKVMLEEDYLALQKHADIGVTANKASNNSVGSQIVRTIILPELEKEVNTGRNFANLRQIFNSIILASWYKKNLKEALLNQVYSDKSKVKGINLNDPTVKQQIYEQYLKAYKKGVFNYIKEDVNVAGVTAPRKYFSGGMEEGAAANPTITTDSGMLASSLSGRTMMDFTAGIITKALSKVLKRSPEITPEDIVSKYQESFIYSISVKVGINSSKLAELIDYLSSRAVLRSSTITILTALDAIQKLEDYLSTKDLERKQPKLSRLSLAMRTKQANQFLPNVIQAKQKLNKEIERRGPDAAMMSISSMVLSYGAICAIVASATTAWRMHFTSSRKFRQIRDNEYQEMRYERQLRSALISHPDMDIIRIGVAGPAFGVNSYVFAVIKDETTPTAIAEKFGILGLKILYRTMDESWSLAPEDELLPHYPGQSLILAFPNSDELYDFLTKLQNDNAMTANTQQMINVVNAAYANGITDEFVKPAVLVDAQGVSVGRIKDGDVVFTPNFRRDRMNQITMALAGTATAIPTKAHDLLLIKMMFDENQASNERLVFPPKPVKNNLGEWLSHLGLKQFRIAETEKFNHVTRFFNGGSSMDAYPGEDRVLIPSPKVATYDMQPEMSSQKVTDELITAINENKHDYYTVNFAQPDMVGHTGKLEAAIKAVAQTSKNVGEVVRAARAQGFNIIITADHGNVDQMAEKNGTPHTRHTTSPVPFIFIPSKNAKITGNPSLTTHFGNRPAGLSDVAPTILKTLNKEQPPEMTGKNLVEGYEFPGNQKTILIIMDGLALNPNRDDPSDAVRLASERGLTPDLDELYRDELNIKVEASGVAVGLPKDQFGNSEVCHRTIGAGRILSDQPLTLVNQAIENDSFFHNEALLAGMQQAKEHGKSFHMLGLVSGGGVHSSMDHIYATLKMAKEQGLSQVYIHAILDGRDTDPKSAEIFLRELQAKIHEIGIGQIVDMVGRYYPMDRDNNWERTKVGYDLYVEGKAEATWTDAAMLSKIIPNFKRMIRSWGFMKNAATYTFENSPVKTFQEFPVDDILKVLKKMRKTIRATREGRKGLLPQGKNIHDFFYTNILIGLMTETSGGKFTVQPSMLLSGILRRAWLVTGNFEAFDKWREEKIQQFSKLNKAPAVDAAMAASSGTINISPQGVTFGKGKISYQPDAVVKAIKVILNGGLKIKGLETGGHAIFVYYDNSKEGIFRGVDKNLLKSLTTAIKDEFQMGRMFTWEGNLHWDAILHINPKENTEEELTVSNFTIRDYLEAQLKLLTADSAMSSDKTKITRRDVLKWGSIMGGGLAVGAIAYKLRQIKRERAKERIQKLTNPTNGGIDLNTSSGMQWKVSKDGNGVEMDINPAMIERVKSEGINWLSSVIFKMTPINSVWTLVGLQCPTTPSQHALT